MLPFRRTPDARYIRALTLSAHWGVYRSSQGHEDPLTYAFAKFKADVEAPGRSYIEQERYMAVRPMFAELYWLTSCATNMSASFENDTFGSRQTRPVYDRQAANYNVVVQNQRSVVKALVVAGASPEFISQQLDISVEVVANFEKLCWDIRSRAESRAWLQSHLFANGIHRETGAADYERLLFHRAYAHGLEAVIDYLHLTGYIVDPAGYTKKMTAKNKADLSAKTAAGIQIMPYARGDAAVEIITTSIKTEQADRDAELKVQSVDVGKGQPAEERIMKAMTSLAPTVFAPVDPRVVSTEAEERQDPQVFQVALAKALTEAGVPS